MATDVRVGITESVLEKRLINRAHAVENAECVEATEWVCALAHLFLKKWDSGSIALDDKQPLRGVALPAAWAVEGGDEGRCVELIEAGDLTWVFVDGVDLGGAGLDGDGDADFGGGGIGVAAEVMIVEDEVEHGVAVVVAEPVVPVVAGAAVLGDAGGGFDEAFVGADAKIAAADVDD